MKYNIELIDLKHKIIIRNVWAPMFDIRFLQIAEPNMIRSFLSKVYVHIINSTDLFFKYGSYIHAQNNNGEHFKHIIDDIYEI